MTLTRRSVLGGGAAMSLVGPATAQGADPGLITLNVAHAYFGALGPEDLIIEVLNPGAAVWLRRTATGFDFVLREGQARPPVLWCALTPRSPAFVGASDIALSGDDAAQVTLADFPLSAERATFELAAREDAFVDDTGAGLEILRFAPVPFVLRIRVDPAANRSVTLDIGARSVRWLYRVRAADRSDLSNLEIAETGAETATRFSRQPSGTPNRAHFISDEPILFQNPQTERFALTRVVEGQREAVIPRLPVADPAAVVLRDLGNGTEMVAILNIALWGAAD